jgi:hypothetical protein
VNNPRLIEKEWLRLLSHLKSAIAPESIPYGRALFYSGASAMYASIRDIRVDRRDQPITDAEVGKLRWLEEELVLFATEERAANAERSKSQ